MEKVLRKLFYTTTKTKFVLFVVCCAIMCISAVAFASTKKASTSTTRMNIASGYWAQGKFEAKIDSASFLVWSFSSIGSANGDTLYTNARGSEVDYQYVDCALANATCQFTMKDGAYVTVPSTLLPTWTCTVPNKNCKKVTMNFCKLWDACSKVKLCDANNKTVTVSR